MNKILKLSMWIAMLLVAGILCGLVLPFPFSIILSGIIGSTIGFWAIGPLLIQISKMRSND
jgi:hypothetical protein